MAPSESRFTVFETLLIANRGEIACRVMRTARRLGMRCVAVYTEPDADAMHVGEADAAYPLGDWTGYLDGKAVLAAARASGAQAIHPGYGFLAENADFAEACADAGITFVGPPSRAIRSMGEKDAARALMIEVGVPVVPGDDGSDQADDALAAAAERVGYPVLLKPTLGGGGKGMRVVETATDFAAALIAARREATAAFGDDRILVERFLDRPRHIEVQVFGDAQGNLVHLFERECSLQRRHQKIVEEAPRVAGVPPLTTRQIEAIDLLHEVAEELCLRADFEPGDVQLINNHVIYHARDAFEDGPGRDGARDAGQGEGGRLLLRIWLSMANSRPLPTGHAVLWGATEAGALRGGIAQPG